MSERRENSGATSGLDFARYLLAKRTVDDRALYRPAFERVLDRLAGPGGAVLDVASGVGAMLERLGARGALVNQTVCALERDPRLLAVAGARLGTLPARSLELVGDDFFGWAEPAVRAGRSFGVVIACAFLDLVPLAKTLALLRALVEPGGLLYLPICFDGATVLLPALLAAPEEEPILAAYHRTMDERAGGTTGGAHTGRRLFGALEEQGLEVLAAGSSDWVVLPLRAGASECYPDHEAFFLRFLVEGIAAAVEGRPGLSSVRVDAWRARRLQHIAEGRLVLVAHQLDFLCRRPTCGAAAGGREGAA